MKYIIMSIIWGNPVDGCEYIGPFNSAEEANAYAERWLGDWWMVLLQEPAREENDDE